LGLSQVYGFVRQSAGHVKIYSEVSEGTSVKIYLPRYQGESDSVKIKDVATNATRAIGKETILVVEDDEALRSYTTESLRELGYRVLEAASGERMAKADIAPAPSANSNGGRAVHRLCATLQSGRKER
jgi:PleD family two-component response regulator